MNKEVLKQELAIALRQPHLNLVWNGHDSFDFDPILGDIPADKLMVKLGGWMRMSEEAYYIMGQIAHNHGCEIREELDYDDDGDDDYGHPILRRLYHYDIFKK